jgi:lipopolysaccharide cholinephosphotransferase
MNSIQAAELRILKFLCAFLDAHNLCYYLVFGTLLGSVRHNGFIPWDDDIDIAMPRDDYNKLLAFSDTVFGSSFKLHEITRQDDYYELYAKFVDTSTSIQLLERQRRAGNDKYLWIDIFPLDGLPKNKINVFFLKINSIFLRRIYQLSISDFTYPRNRIKNTIIKLICKHLSYKNIYTHFLKLISRYPFHTAGSIASITEMNKTFYVYPSDVFGIPSKVLFEDSLFNAPAKSITYLEMQYGDYMKLPPESERNTHLFIMDEKL